MKWYTIDPGISGLGLATFIGDQLINWETIYGKGKDFKEKTTHILNVLEPLLANRTFFIEWPTGNFHSAKGIAAQNSDAILKLCFLIGGICSKFKDTHLIPVQRWKGNLPKEITQKRAEKFFGITGFKSHAADAVGLGQYVIENNLLTSEKQKL